MSENNSQHTPKRFKVLERVTALEARREELYERDRVWLDREAKGLGRVSRSTVEANAALIDKIDAELQRLAPEAEVAEAVEALQQRLDGKTAINMMHEHRIQCLERAVIEISPKMAATYEETVTGRLEKLAQQVRDLQAETTSLRARVHALEVDLDE